MTSQQWGLGLSRQGPALAQAGRGEETSESGLVPMECPVMVTWQGLLPSPSHPISFRGASAEPRVLSSGPRSASSCSVMGSWSSLLGPQFAALYSDKLGSMIHTHKAESSSFCSQSQSTSCESRGAPAPRGFPSMGRDWQCLKGRTKARPGSAKGSVSCRMEGHMHGEQMEEKFRAGQSGNSDQPVLRVEMERQA